MVGETRSIVVGVFGIVAVEDIVGVLGIVPVVEAIVGVLGIVPVDIFVGVLDIVPIDNLILVGKPKSRISSSCSRIVSIKP
jgi:hypothetical protein